MPAIIPRERISGASNFLVIPTATELSTTTVAPGLAYNAIAPIASLRYEVFIPLSGNNDVGTAIKKCVAGAIALASAVQVIDEAY
jgi:hypothetical protein